MKQVFAAFLIIFLFSCKSSKKEEQPVATIPPVTNDTVKTPPPVTGPEIAFDSYCNSRYKYCIDYPTGMIYPQPESTNGDGRVFKNKQGEKVLTVYGRWAKNPNGDELTLAQQYDNDLQGADEENGNEGRTLTYHKLGKDFFVISGYQNKKIFYQKTILKEGAFCYAVLRYDESEKEVYDKVSERIFSSFK